MLFSFGTKTPVQDMLGETTCWVLKFGMICNVMKYILGGFFMSIYRLICMKKPSIALNTHRLRKISIELIVLEWITLGFLHGLYFFGTKLRGTSVGFGMLRGHSTIFDDTIKGINNRLPCWNIPITLCLYFYQTFIKAG